MAKTPAERQAEVTALFDGDTNVYIDWANIRNGCSGLGWNIRLNKLKALLDATGKVKSARFYFGTIIGDSGSEGFVARARKEGFEVETKPVKFMNLPINVSSISPQSTDILKNFIHGVFLRELSIKAIEYLNQQLGNLNKQGKYSLKHSKCNFDVDRYGHAARPCT